MRTRTIAFLTFLFAVLLSAFSVASLRAAPSGDAVVNAPCTQAAFDAALDSVQGTGGGTITFACGGPATITFTNQKRIETGVTIAGGNSVTLSGGNTTRLFNILPGASLSLRQIILTNGNAGSTNGGAVLNRGTLVIQDSVVRNSQAERGGGVYSQTGSNLTVTRSTFTGNSAAITGGAIEVKRANATISTSTISNNSAVFGAGVFNALGTTVMMRATVNNNTATAGAGVNNNQGTMRLTNVTISNNSATAGAGLGNSGQMTLSFVTFSGNSANYAGGIYHFGFNTSQTLTIANTILDAGLGGQNCFVPASSATTITSNGFNLSSDTSCTSNFTKPGDQNNVDPRIGPLANNGSAMMTHFPGTFSPARDGGQCLAGVIIDQRGVVRPQGPACDIGSVEAGQP
jgi:hypothetical protein